MAVTVDTLGPKALELTVHGTLEKQDYELFIPHADARIDEHGALDLLVNIANLSGFTPSAFWADLKFGVSHFDDIRRLALVSADPDNEWMATLARPFTSADVEFFHATELDAARKWVRADSD